MAGVRDLEIRHLLALRAVAEEGSFGRAGARLGFSQAAISQQIAGLEQSIGQAVFDRPGGPRPVEITPAGALLLEHARAILDRLALAEHELAELRAGTHGRLVVGTFQSVSVKMLPSVVGMALAESPDLDITLFETDDNDELIERLAHGDLDLSFLVGPVDDDRLDTVELVRDPFVVLLPGGSADTGAYPTTALAGSAMIGQQDSSCSLQRRIEEGLLAAGAAPRYVFRSNDNSAVQAMVRVGMGAAVLPLLAVDLDDPDVDIRPLDPPLEPRSVLVATRRGRTHAPAVDRFIGLAREVAAEVSSSLPQVQARPGSAIDAV